MEGSISYQLVERVRAEVFSPSSSANNVYSFLPPSAYETAWVAMIPGDRRRRPMFPECLQWILRNQREEGFWGESLHLTLDSLTATIACLLALKTWNTGHAQIKQGLRFLNQNMEKLLMQHQDVMPWWFAIVFPGIIELAQAKGLDVLPPQVGCSKPLLVDDVFSRREKILQELDKSPSCSHHHPIAMFLEALPASHRPQHEVILAQQMDDGSLFHSPSATAAAFIITGDESFREYVQRMVRTCNHIVPPMFPVDQDLIKLCLVEHLTRLGCGEHFAEETRGFLDQFYGNWVMEEQQARKKYDLSLQIQKDSLAFQILRAHGYDVSPRKLCWFMDNKDLLAHMEKNYTEFIVAMQGVYRASQFMFPSEVELHNAKLFSEKVLQKSSMRTNSAIMSDLQKEIEHDLGLPWLARMDLLEQRMYIEGSKGCNLSIGKATSCRLLGSKSAIQLAADVFTNRQLLYKSELEELKRWSHETGLSRMGFGREKTTYCYFLAAAAVNLPLQLSDLRRVPAQCATLVTVIDDFFDEKGSQEELESLTMAVQRWEGKGLSGHSKVIFDALDNLVRDISFKVFNQHGYDVKKVLQEMWQDTFESWLNESNWSKKRHAPSVAEYLEVAKISIAIQVMTLPACCLVIPQMPRDSINSPYSKITELTMIASRLLNDVHSHQKEVEAGKFNMVPLYMKENQGATAEDSIEYIRKTIERKEKEFLEICVSADTYGDAPKEWKDLHLATLKSFRMLFNSSNAFDSPTALLKSISKAFYEPLDMAALEAVLSPEKEMYEPMKKRWDVLWEKSNSKDGLLKSSKSTDYKVLDQGKDRNALRDSKIQMKLSNNIKPSNDGRRSSKIWSISRSIPSTSHVAYITPSIRTTKFF